MSGDYLDKNKYRLDGRTVLITGASSGIGMETVRDLGLRGAIMVIGNRNLEKSAKVIDELLEETPELKKENLKVYKLDLSSLASVKEFATEVKKNHPVIDIFINNAGIMACPYNKTVDGYESQLATNHLGPFLLTHLLIDNVLASQSKPRVINLSSVAHKYGTINFDDLQSEKNYEEWPAYSQSKLANILFAKSLAEKYKGKITTYSVHPGLVMTNLQQHTLLFRTLQKVVPCMWKTPEQGAYTTIYCAVSTQAGEETGLYYADSKVSAPTKKAQDMETAEKLWKVSCELVGVQW